MQEQPKIYDCGADEMRVLTQADVDNFSYYNMWSIRMREIISLLVSQGAAVRYGLDRLDQIKEILK